MLTSKTVWYHDYGIEYDDFGFWTVQFCGDDITFESINDAKRFIDEEMI